MVWAVLQFALPAFASSADAHVERESRAQVAHVESTSTSSCRPVHTAECALCQLVNHHLTPVAQPSAPLILTVVACPAPAEVVAPATAWLGHLPLARAPPLV
jgi:hypothetical protein